MTILTQDKALAWKGGSSCRQSWRNWGHKAGALRQRGELGGRCRQSRRNSGHKAGALRQRGELGGRCQQSRPE